MRTKLRVKSLCRLICGFAVISSLLGGKVSEAATFYVATTGSDGNSCAAAQSPSKPRRTIKAGIPCLSAAGDILDIANGTYAENIYLSGIPIPNGTSWTNATTIRGHGATILQPTEGHGINMSSMLTSRTWSYIVFDSLIIDMSQEPLAIRGDAIRIGAPTNYDHIRITKCVLKHAPGNGALINGDSFWFDHNEIFNTGLYDQSNNGTHNGGHGIYWAGRNGIIEHNYIHDNWLSGAHNYNAAKGADCSGNVWRSNLFKNNDLTAGANGETNGGTNLLLAVGSNISAYNNILIGARYGLSISSSTNVQVYNNTVYNASVVGISIGGNATTVNVANNIVSTWAIKLKNAGPSSTFTANLCSASGSNCAVIDDPRFKSAASGDFTLQSGSLAIDKGVKLTTVVDDYSGTLRPVGAAYDIGAYEYREISLASPTNLTLSQ